MNKTDQRACELRLKEVEALLEPLLEEQCNLEQSILELKSQFKQGDVITWKRGKQIWRGRVVRIKEWVCGDPMWVVEPILKDGSDGKECDVRHYEQPTLVESFLKLTTDRKV